MLIMSMTDSPFYMYKKTLSCRFFNSEKLEINSYNKRGSAMFTPNSRLSIPQILLMNLPPNLCPSIRSENKAKKSEKTKINLMKDFGLAPEQPIISMSRQSFNINPQRTITLSEFMGKKNTRILFNSHDLGSLCLKIKKKNLFNEGFSRKTKKAKTSFKQMDDLNKMKCSQRIKLKSKPKIFKPFQTTSKSISQLKNHKAEINFLDNLVNSCDILLEDNKKIMTGIEKSTSQLISNLKKGKKQIRLTKIFEN